MKRLILVASIILNSLPAMLRIALQAGLFFIVPPQAAAYTTNMNASIVIGQENFTNTGYNFNTESSTNVSGRDLRAPTGIVSYETKLVVGDLNNNRILVFNRIPDKNSASADVVIGQQNFSSVSANQGGSAAANTLSSPQTLALAGKKLVVTDRANNRILIYNQIPTTNNANADIVIGQPDMTTTSSGTSATKLNAPRGVYYDEVTGKLFIGETNNNRVLIYNRLPTQNGAAADVVVGQANFTSDSSNQGGGAGANTLTAPVATIHVGNKLIVTDGNDRTLIYDNITDTPKAIFTSSPTQQPDGKMRFSGDVSLSGGRHSIWKIEASLNGGPFGGVTSLWDTVRTNPGIPDDIIAKFYHDIEPWENNNSTKEQWNEAIDGYTVRFKVYSTNVDLADPFFYFTPFTLNAKSSTLNAPNPQITFSVNKKQINLLKDNLDHYEVWVKKDTWSKYID